MTGLPLGWATAELQDICDFNPKHDAATNRELGVSFVPMPAVNEYSGTIDETETRPLSSVWKGYTHFADGDVIFAKITPCMENGKAAVASGLANGMACGSTEFHVLRARGEIAPDLIWRFMRQETFRNDAESQMSGAVGQRRVPKAYLEKHPIPLPPLPEQQRIVRKLDTLTARTITARTHLPAIAKLVERYKRLVIGQLCLGGVAAQFQDQGDLPVLPIGWEWARAEDLCHWITKGTTPEKDELFSNQGEVPFIKVYNLTFSERLDFSVDPSFVSANTHNTSLKRSKLFPGDVLINIVGPPLGKTAIVPDDFPEWNMNQAIAVFRPKERLFNQFLLFWLSSEWFLSWALSRSKATAGQRNLTLEICRDTPVPLPSFEEQREIVRRIETAFAKIDRLATEAAKALKLTDRLDQRILARAFAGDLVPQDPSDEPAETLLARIREARAIAPKAKRAHKLKK